MSKNSRAGREGDKGRQIMAVAQLVDTLLAVLGSEKANGRLVAFDYRYSTRRGEPDTERMRQRLREDLQTGVHNRLATIRERALSSALLVGSAVCLAIAAHMLGTPWRISGSTLNVASIACLSLATVFRLGWAGQSIGGETAVEQADAALFKLFFWFGTYLATAAQM